jgi:hypothetical protein
MAAVRLTLLLLLAPGVTSAQAPAAQREAAITRIERAYAQTSLLAPDSPFTDNLLGGARASNPNVSDATWTSLKPEITTAVSAVMLDKGGLVDSLVRASVGALSDAELQRLLRIYEDPVFLKMQSAMSSTATQRQIAAAMWSDSVRISTAINAVLRQHGLHEVH